MTRPFDSRGSLRTRQEVADALAQYKAGLEAGIALLRRLETIASRQRTHTDDRDYQALAEDSDTREQLTRGLVAIQPGLSEMRALLGSVDPSLIDEEPDARAVHELRLTTRELVSGILAVDAASMRSLSDAELARRAALASLETGEHTLAAYRRVLTPAVGNASLLDRRG